jgi:hypothetical protein
MIRLPQRGFKKRGGVQAPILLIPTVAMINTLPTSWPDLLSQVEFTRLGILK